MILDHDSEILMRDILEASEKAEPKRSHSLRVIMQEIKQCLYNDLNLYLKCVRKLKILRGANPPTEPEPICSCTYTAIFLKHNHLCWGYRRLMTCEYHLSQQADLFDLL